MFVVSKRNIIVPNQDRSVEFHIPKDFMGEVPAWVSESPYFKSLVKDGKVIVSKSKKDSDVDAAMKADASSKKKTKAEKKTKADTDNKSGAGEAAGDNSGKGDTDTGADGTDPGNVDPGNGEE